MTKRTIFADAEQAEVLDFDAISLNAREGDENLIGDAIGYPSHWAKFAVSIQSPTVARVSQGRYYVFDKAYDLDAVEDIDLTSYLPIGSTDSRYIAIIARGVTETINAMRMVEVDAETGETVQQSLPKTERRRAFFSIQAAVPAVTPVKPTITPGDCVVCFLLVSPEGITAIEASNTHRVKTLYEVDGRLTILEGLMEVLFQSVATIRTDLANLQAEIGLIPIPRPEIIAQLQRDAARTRRILSLPEDTRAYFYDPGLVTDQWDLTHSAWNARVREGVRFPFAAQTDQQLTLTNPALTTILVQDNVVSTRWQEVNRLIVDGAGATKNISQQVHTVRTGTKRTVSRSAIEFGPTIAICENVGEWSQIGSARIGETFQVNGETFENLGLVTDPGANLDLSVIQTWNPGVTNQDIVNWNQNPASAGHQSFAARQVNTRNWTETYWDYKTETFGVNGSVYAQTFLASQPMVLTSIDLKFSRVGTDGVVHLALCETDATGQPWFERILATVSKPRNEITVGWNKFVIEPRFLTSGRRYAWFTVTTGNHELATVVGAKYSQGSLFWSTDGAWAQGSVDEDFCFRLNAARFDSTRTVVEFTPVALTGGMSQFQLIYGNWTPPGCSIVWEWSPTGDVAWYPVATLAENPLSSLPTLIRFRATMIGTTDLSPAIILGSGSRITAQRHGLSMAAVSKQCNFGFSTTEIVVETVVDNFDAARHTVTNKVMVGPTVVSATASTTEADITRPGRYKVVSTFTVSSTNNARLRVEMTTNSALHIPFVQDTSMFAI
ncbi:MAG: hypothetical protein B7Z40_13465 [Bosea sp. 12-68-7]|nr:MAG: hypothetical protein B7Z40_13465 [Bosea sp. 12-68-7]